MSFSLFLLAAALGVVLLLTAVPRLRDRELKGRQWMLLRALFPSWRFFEELDAVPKLWFRMVSESDEAPAGWQPIWVPEPRSLSSLLLNARGNLRMASQSLIEQFMTDVSELPDGARVEDSVSYALTVRLVRFRIRELGLESLGRRFQFKITSATPGQAENTTGEDLLLSGLHEVQSV